MIGYLGFLLLPSFSWGTKEPPTDPAASYSWMPEKHAEAVVWQKLTPRELRSYDGRDGGRVLLAIRGRIFDVSAGRGFYGPGGPYGNFAGRDASRGLAKQSFDDSMLTPVDAPIDELNDLTAAEWSNLRDWEGHFGNKYFVCGELVSNS
ncbi:cytochrome b5 [Atractiella rhizophila]|nr:cytochrome b5 [Atractiella rhizophila]